MDYRLTVSYEGEPFAGWQRQVNAVAVQQVLEEALGAVVGRPVRTTGAGRTDRGVHARGQVVSVRLAEPSAPGALIHRTNRHLPPTVRVLAAAEAPEGFDARRHASGKEYAYRMRRAPVLSPLDARYTQRLGSDVDVDAMRRAALAVVGRHDFSAFAKQGGAHTQPWRTIWRAGFEEQGAALTFRVVGDGFLRGMVRALVGTLLEIGRGKRPVEEMPRLLGGLPRSAAGPTAPAHGLSLERVFYPAQWGGPELEAGVGDEHPDEV